MANSTDGAENRVEERDVDCGHLKGKGKDRCVKEGLVREQPLGEKSFLLDRMAST